MTMNWVIFPRKNQNQVDCQVGLHTQGIYYGFLVYNTSYNKHWEKKNKQRDSK